MRRFVFLGLAIAIHYDTLAHPLSDKWGLEFVSQEAFCGYHCSAAHITHVYHDLRDESECVETICGQNGVAETNNPNRLQRHLRPSLTFKDNKSPNESALVGDVHGASDDGKNVTVISVFSCSGVKDVTLSIGDPETNEFADFYQAFLTAYDAVLSGANAAYDACQLQFLQNELLTTFSADLEDVTAVMEIKPSLIKLNATFHDELGCLRAIKQIWPATSESKTPFLTRRDQVDAAATVMLVHVSETIGDEILALQCVESVTVLPAILKLMPFAKSSYAFSRDSTKLIGGPALEIRLANVADTAQALTRLSTLVTKVTGIKNLITMQSSTAKTGGVLLQAAVGNYHTWTQALATVLDDEAVEWVDVQQVVTTNSLQSLKTHSLEQRLLRRRLEETDMDVSKAKEHVSRRLDDYVEDLVGVTIMHDHSITGSSIIVGITDTGLYIDHDQFDQESRSMYDDKDMTARKVVSYQTFANDVDEAESVTCGHGTHVSGILAGSSYSKMNRDFGIASSARIAFMDIGKQDDSCAGTSGCAVSLETPGEVVDLMQDQVSLGAKIFSFSWGTGSNDYNVQTEQVDDYIYNNPDILIIVAAGNSGKQGMYTISSPSGAKNVVSVGASLSAADSFLATPCQAVLNEKSVASFSSIGPTLDGRQKPDLVAPGMSITSSQSETPGSKVKSSAVCSLQGTSQATPVIAGMAVLIYEWLRDGWWKNGVADPTFGMDTIPASLIKALLIHSGESMSRRLMEPDTDVTSCVALETAAKTLGSYPDFNQGYGKPTMLNLVSFADDNSGSSMSSTSSNTIYFFPNSSAGSEPSVIEGSEAIFHFMLTDGVNLRVTLVWTDPPASVGSRLTLQNDLDLTLKIANTSAVFYPLSGNGTRDSLNNVEMIEISYDDVRRVVNASGMAMDDGNIYVQAVVSGYSVKAGKNATTTGQKFSIVTSSMPSATSTNSGDTAELLFWQPWMTIGAIVMCTLVVLFAIALMWRMRTSMKTSDSKAKQGTPSGLTGAFAGNAKLLHQDYKNEVTNSAMHIHPSYCNVEAGKTRRTTLEKPVSTSCRTFDVSTDGPRESCYRPAGAIKTVASTVREPSHRVLAPPLPTSVRKTLPRASTVLQTPADASRKTSRRKQEYSGGSNRRPEPKRSDGSNRDHRRNDPRWERDTTERVVRERDCTSRKNKYAKPPSTRRNRPHVIPHE